MATLAWIFLTEQQADAAVMRNSPDAAVAPRRIDNPAAAQSSPPARLGDWVLPARLLATPAYDAWRPMLGALPMATIDSDRLFLPPSGD